MRKLLDKPLKFFVGYALIVLIASIPAYYFIINAIWNGELDEHNYIVREHIINGFKKQNFTEEEFNTSLALWNKIQPTTTVMLAPKGKQKDSLFNISRTLLHKGEKQNNQFLDYLLFEGELQHDRFRGLLTYEEMYGKTYQIRIETNMEEASEVVLAISFVTFIFIGFIVTGFIILNKKLSKRIWAPFYDTLEKLKGFDLNSTANLNFNTTDILEFKELNTVLTKLIENNLSIYRQQKEFTENASHELQTPLALLKSKIDLMIQDDSLTEEQRKIIESLNESVSRVSRINKNLLFLARIENKEYPLEKVDVSIRLRSILDAFKEFLTDQKAIDEEIQPDLVVQANESLVEILIRNLLSNALRHSPQEGKIRIALEKNALIISNEGSESLKKEFLFKRFISASSQNPGTGLGLSIVKQICDKYGWKISYQFFGNQHVFSIHF